VKLAALFVFFLVPSAFAAVPSEEIVVQKSQAEAEETVSQPSENARLFLDYKSDLMAPIAGGTDEKRTGLLGNLNFGTEVSLEKFIAWKNARIWIQGLVAHGGDQSLGIGDTQGASNIQSPSFVKLYQAWFEQNLWDGRISLLAGVHDLNSEFYVTDSSTLFLNSSFGVGPEFGKSGANGPSIFPMPGMTVRALVKATDTLSVRLGIYDGIPSDPKNPAVTRFGYSAGHGVLGVMEVNLAAETFSRPSKIGLGLWTYTNKSNHLFLTDAQGEPLKILNQGFYALMDQKITSRLSGFIRGGASTSDANMISQSLHLGMNYSSPFGRETDQAGVGFALASGRSPARFAPEFNGPIPYSHEKTFELTYRAQIIKKVFLQPDLQWILSPGLEDNATSVLVGAVRAQILL
jgi:porin